MEVKNSAEILAELLLGKCIYDPGLFREGEDIRTQDREVFFHCTASDVDNVAIELDAMLSLDVLTLIYGIIGFISCTLGADDLQELKLGPLTIAPFVG